jgi:hypothetical protein
MQVELSVAEMIEFPSACQAGIWKQFVHHQSDDVCIKQVKYISVCNDRSNQVAWRSAKHYDVALDTGKEHGPCRGSLSLADLTWSLPDLDVSIYSTRRVPKSGRIPRHADPDW